MVIFRITKFFMVVVLISSFWLWDFIQSQAMALSSIPADLSSAQSPPATLFDGGLEGVILLHGLARTRRSMFTMEEALGEAGFVVVNIDYASRSAPIEDLAPAVISEALAHPKLNGMARVHFVTHSMGGILVRYYLADTPVPRLGRVVMLGPPNQGSEVVDSLGHLGLFGAINGPAGAQLGTGPDSVPNRLGGVEFELGVIAGDRSVNWINSLMIDGPDDGKVSVARTQVEGMKDHRVIHATHPFLTRKPEAIRETIHFLRHGFFLAPDRLSPGRGRGGRGNSSQ